MPVSLAPVQTTVLRFSHFPDIEGEQFIFQFERQEPGGFVSAIDSAAIRL
jgi:hypothetical protein